MPAERGDATQMRSRERGDGGERGRTGPSGSPPIKPYREILTLEISQAEEELKRPAIGLAISGLIAGLGVGVSALASAAVMTAFGDVFPDGVMRFLVANAFTLGFIIVILAHTDLFTEYTTLAILPVLVGRSTLPRLVRLWTLIYGANMVGAGIFAVLLAFLGPRLGFASPEALHGLALRLVEYDGLVILVSALLTGWLMGMLAWLIAASRDTISQIAFVWLITGTIGFAHLHHPITAAVEVIASLLLGGDVGLAAGARMLVLATIGTSAGGILFAVLTSYGHRMRDNGVDGRARDG